MKNKYYILIAIFGFALDRIAKYFFLQTPRLSESVFINSNFAWGLGLPNNITIGLMIPVLAALLFFIFKHNHLIIWIIIAGALSNLIDRIFYGGVIDYIHTPFGGIINLADIMILAGVLLAVAQGKKRKT